MYVTYTPEDGDKQEWTFNPGRIPASQQAIVEKKAGMAWAEWLDTVRARPGPARRVLIWFLLSRTHDRLRWEDVDPCDDEILVELSVAELERNREEYLKGGGETRNPNHQIVMDTFDDHIAASRAKHGDDGDLGKALSRSGPPPTSG